MCFAAFGPLATGAFYITLMRGAGAAAPALFTPPVVAATVLVGATTTVILFTSHFHQEAGDRAAGKRSPVVKLGLPRAVAALRWALVAHHVVAAIAGCIGALPLGAVCGVSLASPLAFNLARFASAHASTPDALFKTKYLAVRWHVLHGLFLALGLLVPAP